MFDITAIGELLIDMTPIKNDQTSLFQANPGGAPCNMLAMAQKLGAQTSFIGQVGNDQFGYQLKETIKTLGIDTSQLLLSDRYPTTLAFVHLDDDGERSFSFYRDYCADLMLDFNAINLDHLKRTKILHFGSLSFTSDPSLTAVIKVLDYAKSQGILITYDPNYRPALWKSKGLAKERMLMGLKYADILKVSEEEAYLLSGEEDLELAAKALYHYDIQLICITLGHKGSYYYSANGSRIIGGYESDVMDTTGAGDAFFGGVVYHLLSHDFNLSNDVLEQALRLGNACASLVIEKLGGMSAIPEKEDISKRQKTLIPKIG